MRPAHRWIVLYDIVEPKRLRKVAKITESFANRVQKSVYEAFGGHKTVEKLRSKLANVMEEGDSVAFIPICVNDWENTVRYGSKTKTSSDPAENGPIII